MNNTNQEVIKKANEYLSMNSVKSLSNSSLSDRKRSASYKVSDKELAEDIYRWDPAVRQFIRVRR